MKYILALLIVIATVLPGHTFDLWGSASFGSSSSYPAAFNAMMVDSITPTKGTASHARASTNWVPSGNGVLTRVASGSPAFPSLRNVTNQLQYTEDFSNAQWAVSNTGAGTAAKTPNYDLAPDGTQTACRVQLDLHGGTTTGDTANFKQAVSIAGIGGISLDVWLKSLSGTPAIILTAGAATSTTTLTTEWKRYQINSTYNGGIQLSTYLRGGFSTADAADFLIWHPQTLLTTGQPVTDIYYDYSPNLTSTLNSRYYTTKYYSAWDSTVALGDSFTSTNVYVPRIVANMYYASITNKGGAGQKLADMWARWDADVVALAPKAVIIQGGINDIYQANTDPNAGMRTVIQDMIASCVANNIRPIVLNVSTFGGSAQWSADRKAWLESYNAWLAAYTTANGVVLYDLYTLLKEPDNDNIKAAYDSGDHVHPNTAGYNAMGDAIYAVMLGLAPLSTIDLTSAGVLSEPAATNIFANSATPATQTIAVTNVQHVLSFTGTGSVALSGTGSGTLAGTGATNRVQLAFAPTAGNLTLTITGTIAHAQLEISPIGVATSVVESAAATTARAATVLTATPSPNTTLTTANTKKVFTGKVTFIGYAASTDYALVSSYVDANNYTTLLFNGSTSVTLRKRVGGTNYDAVATISAPVVGTEYTFRAVINSDNTTEVSWDNGAAVAQADTHIPQFKTGGTFEIGSLNGANQAFATFKSIKVSR